MGCGDDEGAQVARLQGSRKMDVVPGPRLSTGFLGTHITEACWRRQSKQNVVFIRPFLSGVMRYLLYDAARHDS